MKKKIIILLYTFFIITNLYSQEKKSLFYYGFGLSNFGTIQLNTILDSSNISQINSNTLLLNIGFEYCPKKIGFYIEARQYIGYSKNKLYSQNGILGLVFKAFDSESYNIKILAHGKYAGYSAIVNNQTNNSTPQDLTNANGGLLHFKTSGVSFGTSIVYERKQFGLRVGFDKIADINSWQLINNNFSPNIRESFNEFYFLIYKRF